MIITNENANDVNKYFGNTYVVIKEYNPDVCLLLHKHHGNLLSFIDTISNEQGGLSFDEWNNSYTLDFQLPHKQVFNYGDGVMILERIPARMWKKGISNENTRFYFLVTNGQWKHVSFGSDKVNALLKHRNHPPQFNLDALCSGRALTERMSLAATGKLYIDTFPIGKVDFAKKTLLVMAAFKDQVAKVDALSTFKVTYG